MSTESAPQTYTTGRIARALQISKTTLIRWIKLGYLPETGVVQVGNIRIRAWRREDYLRALEHKRRFYWWMPGDIKRGTNDRGTERAAEHAGKDGTAGAVSQSEGHPAPAQG